MREERLHPRVPLRLEVSWNGSHTRTGIITDISEGGCFIESIVQVAVTEVLRLEFKLGPGISVELEGEVRYVHPAIGFGVRFVHLTPMQLQTVLQLIGSARANQNPAEEVAPIANKGPSTVAA